jgi:hypothetical protein
VRQLSLACGSYCRFFAPAQKPACFFQKDLPGRLAIIFCSMRGVPRRHYFWESHKVFQIDLHLQRPMDK